MCYASPLIRAILHSSIDRSRSEMKHFSIMHRRTNQTGMIQVVTPICPFFHSPASLARRNQSLIDQEEAWHCLEEQDGQQNIAAPIHVDTISENTSPSLLILPVKVVYCVLAHLHLRDMTVSARDTCQQLIMQSLTHVRHIRWSPDSFSSFNLPFFPAWMAWDRESFILQG